MTDLGIVDFLLIEPTRVAAAVRKCFYHQTDHWTGWVVQGTQPEIWIETADHCLGRVVERVTELGGVCLVTADHGNAEQMLEADGVSPHTAHTTNRVPLVVTAPGITLRDGGELADLAPTALDLLGLEKPVVMTGSSLVNPP